MKKSTIKLILLTIAGFIISYICYINSTDVELSLPYPGPARKLVLLGYIAPFAGLFYWVFLRKLDD